MIECDDASPPGHRRGCIRANPRQFAVRDAAGARVAICPSIAVRPIFAPRAARRAPAGSHSTTTWSVHMRRLLLALVPASLLAQAQPVPQTTAKPGWQWTMDSVNAVVNAVRAGRSLQPASWPANARVAVLLSFDADNETIALRYGEPT